MPTIDERLEAIAQNLDTLTKLHLDGERKNEEWREEWREHTVQAEERYDREMAGIRAELRRAVLLSVREARQEGSKRRAIDEKMTQLAAAQLVTEEKLQRLLDASRGNGKP